MSIKAKQLYVNLPVKDVNKSIDFFTRLGFEFNPTFTDEKAACLVIGENMYAMLLQEDFFQTFTKKELANPTEHTEAIVALSVDSKEAVDDLVNKALEAGGKPSNDPMDGGFMYGWSFEDIDGHLWEVLYTDESKLTEK